MIYYKNLETNQAIEFENESSIGIVFFDEKKYKRLEEKEINEFLFTEAKAQKINELKANFEIASKKPYPLKDVKQIDKVGNVIKTIDAFYNIADASSLIDSANIIFAGTFMKMQGFLKVLCASLKIDYNTILTQVNNLSDNPTTEKVANIPYTTKDKDGNEVRILLSFAKIQEIFAHIFTRVANAGNSFNIIEEQIKKASTVEELQAVDIDINKLVK